jgi:hypothetical protein
MFEYSQKKNVTNVELKNLNSINDNDGFFKLKHSGRIIRSIKNCKNFAL